MQSSDIISQSKEIHQWIVEKRRAIHRHPELMYEEFETSRLVQNTLSDLGIEYEKDIAVTGVVGVVGNGEGPCIALRADMDALPIHEEADVDFRSEIDGKMHACGHDCHTAMLLGAARVLKDNESEINGTIKLIFQPAEEGGAGGKMMRDQGVLEDPDVEQIFGLHVSDKLPTGTLASKEGTLLAATSSIKILVSGNGGHAAMPHLTSDPVVTGSKIVVELQTLISRELDPLESGVISITMANAGSATNVIPSSMELQGTIRSLTSEGISRLQQRVREVAGGIAIANRCTAEVTFPGNDFPPTVNDGECWELGKISAGEILGEESVSEMGSIMGGEDFSYYTQVVPGCFSFLGVGNPEIGAVFGVHHPKFKVDEDALSLGTAIHVNTALNALRSL
ncbi:MAG TPA: amidohydrolase [Candidatus Poseidoniales archaeon]|nr:MAG TPA: amidohydrolase [Candidatus Poseidoniales archaeon]HII26531.1 amidohydrolase [Candidatus Thalassarchaeaceae archaeon]|tara:strand:- start:2411 stop:3595 length:1185 start_codon:yes stop_codon:yes gene_type:complete